MRYIYACQMDAKPIARFHTSEYAFAVFNRTFDPHTANEKCESFMGEFTGGLAIAKDQSILDDILNQISETKSPQYWWVGLQHEDEEAVWRNGEMFDGTKFKDPLKTEDGKKCYSIRVSRNTGEFWPLRCSVSEQARKSNLFGYVCSRNRRDGDEINLGTNAIPGMPPISVPVTSLTTRPEEYGMPGKTEVTTTTMLLASLISILAVLVLLAFAFLWMRGARGKSHPETRERTTLKEKASTSGTQTYDLQDDGHDSVCYATIEDFQNFDSHADGRVQQCSFSETYAKVDKRPRDLYATVNKPAKSMDSDYTTMK